MSYSHLTKDQRCTISTMRRRGCSLKEIAEEITRLQTEDAIAKHKPVPDKRSVSSISRELRRNSTKRGTYNPTLANEMAQERSERIVRNRALKPGVLEARPQAAAREEVVARTDFRLPQEKRHTDIKGAHLPGNQEEPGAGEILPPPHEVPPAPRKAVQDGRQVDDPRQGVDTRPPGGG